MIGDGDDTGVLVVDDDAVCREYCVRILHARGYRVVAARHAREALDLLAEHRPRLVLCDVHLPDPEERDAVFAACDPAATGAYRPALLLMSADAGDWPSRPRPSAAGPALCKPFTPDDLSAAVKRALSGREPAARSGVRDQSREADMLEDRFRDSLGEELAQLDRNLTDGQWAAAIETLHRLRGGAAISGHPRFAQRCRRLSASLGPDGPASGWADRYLSLLRLGERLLGR